MITTTFPDDLYFIAWIIVSIIILLKSFDITEDSFNIKIRSCFLLSVRFLSKGLL